jgi:uncharacterized protein
MSVCASETLDGVQAIEPDTHVTEPHDLGTSEHLSMRPSDYFRRQVHACYWFTSVRAALTVLGPDNILFKTDFHRTCMYPDSMARAAGASIGMDRSVTTKILSTNVASLYRSPPPSVSDRMVSACDVPADDNTEGRVNR